MKNRILLLKSTCQKILPSLLKIKSRHINDNNVHFYYFSSMKNFILFFTICTSLVYSQTKFSISGTVKDSASGEDMIGAIVADKAADVAVETNEYGFYSLSVPAGKRAITIEYPGYTSKTYQIDVQNNVTYNFNINEEVTVLKEVVITEKKPDENLSNVKMSTNNLDLRQIKTLPALFGEVDIIKNLQTLPGVQTAGEGTTGYFVRGGGSDQNLILLDEAPVYNGSHILGFFSVFNSEAIKNAELYKGAIPAQFGGRLSSLLDIRSKDGNNKRFAGGASVGLISGKFSLEGPIKKNRSSFIISGRRSWADMFLKLNSDPDVRKNQLYFYDLNAKVNYTINDKNRIFVAGYFGRDKLKFGAFGIGWGNATGTVRWNHIYNSKVFSNTSLIFSNFDYKLDLNTGGFRFDWTSNLKEVGLKHDFNIFASNKIEINTGVQLNYRYFQPGKVNFSGLPGFNNIVLNDLKATEEAAYISLDYKLNAKWFIQYGTRLTAFQHIGDAKVNVYKDNIADQKNLIGTKNYESFQTIKNYWAVEPRLATRYRINSSTAIKSSLSRNVQFLHLISNSTIPLPTAVWVPSTSFIKPQYAHQIATGIFKNLKDNAYEVSAEVYYKKMFDVTDFKDNAQLFLNPNMETEIRQGTAQSYGLELFVKKNLGRFNGWISYTLSKSTRQVDGVNNSEEFRADYDRRHNFNFIANYDLGRNWTAGMAFVYATGRPYTLATGSYKVFGVDMPIYTERNGYIMPAFHRLDVSFTKKWTSEKNPHFERSLNISIYNVYNRKNPYFVSLDDKKDAQGQIIPNEKQVNMYWLFPILPSISYSINF